MQQKVHPCDEEDEEEKDIEEEDDEGHGSLSDKSSTKNDEDEAQQRDKKVTKKKKSTGVGEGDCAEVMMMAKKVEEGADKKEKRELEKRRVGTISLPRIPLSKG